MGTLNSIPYLFVNIHEAALLLVGVARIVEDYSVGNLMLAQTKQIFTE